MQTRQRLPIWGVAAVALSVLAAAMAASSGVALAQDDPLVAPASPEPPTPIPRPTPHAMSMSPTERLAPPPMSNPPTQIELGHHEYWMSCMVCHGERGQGLTEEWRSVLDPEDQNCWQAKCHGAAHPPYGFEIPRTSPLIMGTGALRSYKTACDLFEYMRAKMPWSYPGLFEDENYWALSAYLLMANEVDLGDDPLGPDNARKVLVLPGLVQTPHPASGGERVVAGVMAGLLCCAAILYGKARAP